MHEVKSIIFFASFLSLFMVLKHPKLYLKVQIYYKVKLNYAKISLECVEWTFQFHLFISDEDQVEFIFKFGFIQDATIFGVHTQKLVNRNVMLNSNERSY